MKNFKEYICELDQSTRFILKRGQVIGSYEPKKGEYKPSEHRKGYNNVYYWDGSIYGYNLKKDDIIGMGTPEQVATAIKNGHYKNYKIDLKKIKE